MRSGTIFDIPERQPAAKGKGESSQVQAQFDSAPEKGLWRRPLHHRRDLGIESNSLTQMGATGSVLHRRALACVGRRQAIQDEFLSGWRSSIARPAP